MVEAEDSDAPAAEWRPSQREWNLTNVLLATLIDKLEGNTATTVAAAGAKPPKVKAFPRPESPAVEIVERLKREKQRDNASLFGF